MADNTVGTRTNPVDALDNAVFQLAFLNSCILQNGDADLFLANTELNGLFFIIERISNSLGEARARVEELFLKEGFGNVGGSAGGSIGGSVDTNLAGGDPGKTADKDNCKSYNVEAPQLTIIKE